MGRVVDEHQVDELAEIVGNLDETTSDRLGPTPANKFGDLPSSSLYGEWGDLFMYDVVAPSTTNSMLESTELWQPDADQTDRFAYFSLHVEPPFITPWDSLNWARMKTHLLRLSDTYPSVSAAIFAVETLYKTVGKDGDGSEVLAHYFTAKSLFLESLQNDKIEMDILLLNTLLLCCVEVIAQQDTIPVTLKQKDLLVSRMENWSSRPWSPIARRAAVWLRLLHTKASHLGGRGMLSARVLEALCQGGNSVPSLAFMSAERDAASTALLDSYYQSLFHFYLELQDISTKASGLNRHHRSRGALEDEVRVDCVAQDIKQQLNFLWQARPPIIDVAQSDLAELLKASANLPDLIHLSILCRVSYHAEIIYLSRAHGLNRGSKEISTARANIRDMIDCGVEAGVNLGQLHPAFIWPLFLYSVESTMSVDVEWAMEKLDRISNPLWQVPFIRTFVKALTKEQLRKNDRVDSRYLCYEEFGIAPPFL